MMILTGYVGQFYETTNTAALLVWGAISSVFFVHVLFLIRRVIREGSQGLPPRAAAVMGGIWWLFFISWMLYPGGYLMSVLMNSEAGVVGRQITYTVADISSKVIYGILLTLVAQIRSQAEGYDPDATPALARVSQPIDHCRASEVPHRSTTVGATGSTCCVVKHVQPPRRSAQIVVN